MTVAHMSLSATTRGGGIPEVIRALTLALADQGYTSVTAALEDDGEALGPWLHGSPKLLPAHSLGVMRWAPAMDRFLAKREPDLVHSHGLWTYVSKATTSWGRRKRRPWVVSPHGMLEPWALGQARWKKSLATRLFERSHLQEATCIHALCQAEADSIRAYGLTNPIVVVPNGVDLPQMDRRSDSGIGRKTILFLGRLHPKKGLLNALEAWSMVRMNPNGARSDGAWRLVIAGWEEDGHAAELRKRCDALGLTWTERAVADLRSGSHEPSSDTSSVVFTGPAFGADKVELLRSADAFILPSFSEGLPMSVLEAWAYGLPVLMTDHCHLPQGFSSGAAIRIETDATSIAHGLRNIFKASESEMANLSQKGRRLVAEEFSWTRVAGEMCAVYEWALDRGPVPSCLQLCDP